MARGGLDELRRRNEALRAENEEVSLRLEEAVEALEAIRTGQVDSLVIDGPDGPKVFSLEGATHSYRVLIEEMNEGAATLAEDGTILYCNACFARLIERPLERTMGSPFLDHVAAPLRGAGAALLERARDADVREEIALVAASGEEIPAYLSVSAIVDQGRRVLCLVAVDLRQQKKGEALVAAERAARASEARLQAILRMMAEGYVVLDAAGRVVEANPAAAAHFGRPAAELVGAPITAVTGAGPGSPIAERFERAMRDQQPARFEIESEMRPGVWLEMHVYPQPERFDVYFHDISERKRAETAVREADRHKSEFLGVLSHELRNPLAPIRNSLYVLARVPPGSDKATRAQAVIERQVDHLARLVDDLLDVTRISRGKVQLERERIDLVPVVARTAEDHRSAFVEAGVELTAALAGEPLVADADATRVAQVVGNLLTNAVKFTPPGGHVELACARDAGDAVLCVRDDGAGIAPELIDTIFEPFTQADRTLARSRGGLGLGLSLVRGLVELHGGSVSATSAGPGLGAEICVRLPLAPTPPAAERSAE